MNRELNLRDPIRPLTQAMLAWASELEVIDKETYPLCGASQKRTWDPDPRLVSLTISLTAKSSDVICYYNQLAVLRHKKDGLVFVVFKETRDALLAQQTDPNKYPLWLIDSAVKNTELKTFIAVAHRPPKRGLTSIWDWLAPIEEHFPDAGWIYDVLTYILLTRGIIDQAMYGQPG